MEERERHPFPLPTSCVGGDLPLYWVKQILVLNIRNPLQCQPRRFRIELQPPIGV
jgi:hypothetical protein